MKSRKIISGFLIGIITFSAITPKAYADKFNTNYENLSISEAYDFDISDKEMQKFEDDIVKMMKEDENLQSELKNILKDEYSDKTIDNIIKKGNYQTRSAASSAVKKSIKAVANWFKKNGMKVWNKLPNKVKKYFAAQGASGFVSKLGEVVDAYTDISDSIDEFVYNVLRDVLPSQVSDWWVDKISRTVRLIIPSPI